MQKTHKTDYPDFLTKFEKIRTASKTAYATKLLKNSLFIRITDSPNSYSLTPFKIIYGKSTRLNTITINKLKDFEDRLREVLKEISCSYMVEFELSLELVKNKNFSRIDQWKINEFRQPLGAVNPTIIRTPNLPNIEDRSEAIQNVKETFFSLAPDVELSRKYPAVVTPTDCKDFRFLIYNNILCIVLLNFEESLKKFKALSEVYKRGVPIILLIRKNDLSKEDVCKALEKSMNNKEVIKLVDEVLELRKQAFVNNIEQHLGNHITLIWNIDKPTLPDENNIPMGV
ncbi:MAG: hypothetical protein JNN15_15370 [Blastocatellia bacterium]|nr:hypothetical protein [Blastocatellia bacterium]